MRVNTSKNRANIPGFLVTDFLEEEDYTFFVILPKLLFLGWLELEF